MPRRDNAFRSGRLPDVNRGSMLGRRGKSRAGARATMDLGRLARGAELGVGDGERGPGGAAQVRTPSLIGSFFRSLFTRADNHDTRPVPRDGVAPAARRYGHLSGDAPPPGSRAGRAAAASSLGSLQSYATSTIRGAGAGCLSPASTSEVDVRKRVLVRRDESERLVFAEASKTGGGGALMSARAPAFDYPNFALGEYGGRNTWMSDVFVLMHNAIRWEIMDVYNILSSMQRRWTSLQMVDVWDFSEHWEVFEVFVAQYFEIEDQIIFPFMLNVAAQSSELARYHKVVKYNKERLESILLEIGLTLEKFNTAAPSEVMPILYDKLVSCLPKLLDYMTEQEQVLPKVFQQYCDPEDRTLLNRACANFLVRATNGRHGIAILTRWIEDSMVLQMWKNENLSARAKQSHKKWVAALQVEHVDIVNRFQRRMRNLQKDRRPGAMADRSDAPGRSGGGGGGRSALRDAAVADTLDPALTTPPPGRRPTMTKDKKATMDKKKTTTDEKVRLFVGNLAQPVTDSAITSMLSKFGEVSELTRNRERRFAHLWLKPSEESSAQKCVSALNQTRWFGAMLRIEIATEHFETRLKREWAAEREPPTDAKPSSANESPPEASFSWKGKRTVFTEASGTRRGSTVVDTGGQERGVNGVSTREVKIRTMPKASARVEATLDLFGLGEDEPEPDMLQPKLDEGRVAKRAREAVAEVVQKDSAADEAAMAAIGDDPSRIDLAAERARALAIMSQLLATRGQKGKSVSESVAESVEQCRRKALYLTLTDRQSAAKADNAVSCAPSFGLEISDGNDSMSGHRRKGLYRRLVSD